MKLRCTFEFEVPDNEGRIAEVNDMYYEAWRAASNAGPCWVHDWNGAMQPSRVTNAKVEILDEPVQAS